MTFQPLRPKMTFSTGVQTQAFLLLAAGAVFLRGLILMLLFGVLHGWVSAAVPAVGFWHSTVIALLLDALFSVRFNANKD